MSGPRVTEPAIPPFDTAAAPSGPERAATALAAAPLLAPAVGVAGGILIDSILVPPAWLCVLAFAAVGAMLLPCWRRGYPCAVILVMAGAATGAALHQTSYRRTARDHIVFFSDCEPIAATVTGTVLTEPALSRPEFGAFNPLLPRPARTRFVLEAGSVRCVDGDRPVTGLVRVSVAEPVLHVRAGDRVRLCGRLYRPMGASNPGERDWSLHFRREGLLVGLSCEHAGAVERLATGTPGPIARLRRHCRNLLLDSVEADEPAGRSVLEAIILGQRSAVDRAINDAFVAVGVVHILSVSGAHLGMLAAWVWGIAALLGRSRRQTGAIVMATVLLYAALAEPNAPVLRSATTAALLCLGVILRRPIRVLNWLSAAAIAVLAMRPTDLFDPGFQLSYVTLAGVIWMSGPVRTAWRTVFRRQPPDVEVLRPPSPEPSGMRRWIGAALRWLEWALAVSIAAWLIGAPVSLYHFGQISTWGWLNSLLVAPVVSLVMFAGFLKLIAAELWPGTAGLAGPVVTWAIELLNAWVGLLSRIPGVTMIVPSPPPGLVLGALAGAVLWMSHGPLRIPGRIVRLWFAIVGVAGVFWWLPGRPGDGELHVRFLAVGDGSAVLVRLPSGRALLYDAGSMPPYELYRSVLRPALAAEGVRRLDAIIISHPNLDHFSAVLDTCRYVAVREVWVTSHFAPRGRGGAAGVLLDGLDRLGVPVRHVHRGDAVTGTGSAGIEILWPPPDPPRPLEANDSSIVLRVAYAGRSVLLTGDIEQQPQQFLIQNECMAADVLMLPHHGHIKPWTGRFVEALRPRILVRSSGRRDSHSPPEIRELTRQRIYGNTADVGQILIRIRADGRMVVEAAKAAGRSLGRDS